MTELTYKQKIAMMRILLDLVLADERVDERESTYFVEIAKLLDLKEDAKIDVDKKNSLLALCEIQDFTREEKEMFAKMMGKMIVVDEDINYNEVCVYNVVNDFCKINVGFQIEDYPQYTLSGEVL